MSEISRHPPTVDSFDLEMASAISVATEDDARRERLDLRGVGDGGSARVPSRRLENREESDRFEIVAETRVDLEFEFLDDGRVATVLSVARSFAHDPVVDVRLGEETRKALEARSYAVSWRTYPMPHAVCPEEIADITSWLQRVL